jgi:hypothetical protein
MLVASARMHECVRADASPVRVDGIFIFIFILFLRPCGRTYALTFFLSGCKCELGVDIGCGRKHFLDLISNPHI